jgi:hypothetical protein
VIDDGKRTETVSFKVSERTLVDLSRYCAMEDRKLSEFLNLMVRRHLYGHLKADESDEQTQK